MPLSRAEHQRSAPLRPVLAATASAPAGQLRGLVYEWEPAANAAPRPSSDDS